MFIFAAGMGIPLIIGSALMAHVLPLLDRFQNGTRYLSIASAGMMLFIGVPPPERPLHGVQQLREPGGRVAFDDHVA